MVFALIDEGYLAKDGSIIVDQIGKPDDLQDPDGHSIGTHGETHLFLSCETPDILITAFSSGPTGTWRG